MTRAGWACAATACAGGGAGASGCKGAIALGKAPRSALAMARAALFFSENATASAGIATAAAPLCTGEEAKGKLGRLGGELRIRNQPTSGGGARTGGAAGAGTALAAGGARGTNPHDVPEGPTAAKVTEGRGAGAEA